MAIQGLENNTYGHQIVFYDGERRARKGASECTSNSTSDYPKEWGLDGRSGVYIYGEKYDCYVQQYTLDGTNTSSSNKKRITACSLANGCSYVYDYYYFGELGPDDVFDLEGKWLDANGNVISSMGTDRFQVPISTTYGETSSSKIVWISPPAVNWYDVPESGIAEAGSFDLAPSITWRHNNSSPYEAPALNQMIGRQNFETYYSRYWRASSSETAYQDFIDRLEAGGDGTIITPQMPSEDTSEPGGGDQNADYDPFSDPIAFPGLPTAGSALGTGFIRVYEPSGAQLQALAAELWSDDFINTIKKIQNDPMEAIISLHSLPFSVAGGNVTCKVGNYTSNVTMPAVAGQYAKRNLGSINIPEHWGSALDYAPYVNIDIYLPYLGVRSLQVDDVIGKTLTIEYNVDVISGACVACIMCGNSVLYTYNTNLITEHPISQSSFAPLLQTIVGATGSVLSGYGMAGAPGAVGAVIGSGINVALSKQHSISRGGSIGGNSGCMGSFVPYLIIHRPIQSLASGFRHFKGYPSNITGTIGSVSGYTEVESVHLNGITCTDNEKAEIEALLYNGVLV